MSKNGFPIQPLHEKIIVLPFSAEEKTTGGIIVPDSAKERPNKATVIAVGSGTNERAMALKVGDVVLHVKGAGMEIECNGEKYFLMRDTDCLAKLTDK